MDGSFGSNSACNKVKSVSSAYFSNDKGLSPHEERVDVISLPPVFWLFILEHGAIHTSDSMFMADWKRSSGCSQAHFGEWEAVLLS